MTKKNKKVKTKSSSDKAGDRNDRLTVLPPGLLPPFKPRIPFPPYPWEPPGWIPPGTFPLAHQLPISSKKNTDRSVEDPQFSAINDSGDEFLRRILARPDYEPVVRRYSEELARLIDEDPEALEIFTELFIKPSQHSSDRIGPVIIYGSIFVASAVLGYMSEK